MYKKIISIVFLIIFIPLSAQQVSGIYYSVGGENNTQYVYANITYVRSGPGINYEVIDKLKMGKEVTISDTFKSWNNTDIYTQNGLTAYWLPVTYSQDGIQKQGFVWQGNLTLTQMRRGTTQFIYGINAIETNKEKDYTGELYETEKYKVELKIVKNDSLLAKKIFLANTEQTYTTANVFENLGLKEVENIIRISFLGQACGIPSYFYYFAWNGKEIIELPHKFGVSDAGVYYYNEEFIFPLEKGGKPNTIIKKIEEREVEEEERIDDYDNIPVKKKTIEYLWNGKSYKKIK